MPYLVDTNILLRSIDPSHPMNAIAVQALTALRGQGEQLCIVPQNLVEFWSVYTRPLERNGLGRTPAEANVELAQLKTFFPLLLDVPVIPPVNNPLVKQLEQGTTNAATAR